jgi:DNA-binding beta-propeller fold protein YncE
VGIASLPQPLAPGEEANPYSTFMMTFRNAAQVRLIRYAPDDPSPINDPRPYLVDGYGVGIEANSVGTDSRGIALDASARAKAKSACAEGDTKCAEAAALVPIDVYVANRAPSSLLIGRTRPPQEYPYFYQSIALTTGPSRVVVGHVTTPEGADETRVFVACFDSRRIFVYDPQRSRIETEILTGRGPHAMTVDTERQLLYVGHFTDSYVGVYSLDLAHPATYGTMLGTLGTPKAPRASK